MKKIAVIGIKGLPSRTSGIEVHAENIYSRLSEKYHITAFCRKRYCTEICRMYKKIEIKYIPSINTKCLDAITYTFLSTIIALFEKNDIYHFHALGPASMCWLPKLFGKKVVCTIHGLDWKREKWGRFGKAFLKFGEKMIAKYADEVVVLTKCEKLYFEQKWTRTVNVIPNGVSIPCFEQQQSKLNISGEYILFLARLVPEKGVHYLIKAFNQSDSKKKLVIAGGSSHSNEYITYLKSLAKKNDNILFVGNVAGSDLISLFQNASLYILPSDIEGLPMSLLEAMSYGCTCLVSDIEANVETLGKYGFYFKHSDIQDLTEKINDFELGNMKCDKQMLTNYVNENYNWDKIAEMTNTIYERIEK